MSSQERTVKDHNPKSRVLRSALAATAVVGSLATTTLPSASAAPGDETIINVTTVDNCDVGGTVAGSLRAAVEAANASTNADGVIIQFDPSVGSSGLMTFTGTDCRMHTTGIGTGGLGGHTAGSEGAWFIIDATVPVTIDFSNLQGIDSSSDSDIAAFLVESNNVRLTNLQQLRAGATGIAVAASNVTISNMTIKDDTTPNLEYGVYLLPGAGNVTVDSVNIISPFLSGIYAETGLVFSGLTVKDSLSRGGEGGNGHITLGNNVEATNVSITGTTFGVNNTESSTSHALQLNSGVKLTDLTFNNNTVHRGAGAARNVIHVDNSTGVTVTNATLNGNTFAGVSKANPLGRIIETNTATWNGLTITNNEADFTGGIRLGGAISDVDISGNTFNDMREPSDALIALGSSATSTQTDVTVSNNDLNTVWALDAIRVTGEAENVEIANNSINEFYADVSRAAIWLAATGTGNSVVDNTLIQDLSRGNGTDLPTSLANHWAIRVNSEASAATATASTGWEIRRNFIDGYGGNPDIISAAPISNYATGRTLVIGNRFGTNVRGFTGIDSEYDDNWFLWNVYPDTNHRIQTYRAGKVRYDGTNATFTATNPTTPASGNVLTTGPVTLHVYWTQSNFAEVYLGEILNVTAGQRVSIPTTFTTGFLRLQTVDAAGNTSQYSSIDVTDTGLTPAAPTVAAVDTTTASGTAPAGSTVEIRNDKGDVVKTALVASDGKWSVNGLACGTTYRAVTYTGGVDSAATALTTTACPAATTTTTAAPAAAPAVKVTAADATGVRGVTKPGAKVAIVDTAGNVVAMANVDGNGNWSVDASKLRCGTTYNAVATGDGMATEATSFSSVACGTTRSGANGAVPGKLAYTGSSSTEAMVSFGVVLIGLGVVLRLRPRRRVA